MTDPCTRHISLREPKKFNHVTYYNERILDYFISSTLSINVKECGRPFISEDIHYRSLDFEVSMKFLENYIVFLILNSFSLKPITTCQIDFSRNLIEFLRYKNFKENINAFYGVLHNIFMNNVPKLQIRKYEFPLWEKK